MEYSNTMINILQAIGTEKVTRRDICRKTGLPRTTVYDNLRTLKKLGEVEWTQDRAYGVRGRPRVRWYIV